MFKPASSKLSMTSGSFWSFTRSVSEIMSWESAISDEITSFSSCAALRSRRRFSNISSSWSGWDALMTRSTKIDVMILKNAKVKKPMKNTNNIWAANPDFDTTSYVSPQSRPPVVHWNRTIITDPTEPKSRMNTAVSSSSAASSGWSARYCETKCKKNTPKIRRTSKSKMEHHTKGMIAPIKQLIINRRSVRKRKARKTRKILAILSARYMRTNVMLCPPTPWYNMTISATDVSTMTKSNQFQAHSWLM